MPRHIEAWLNGTALSSVGPFILKQVTEEAPELDISTGDRPGRPGQLLLGRQRKSLRITLDVQIRELFDLMNRTQAMEALAQWAVSGGVLTLSNHPGRRLNVYCSQEPSLGAARDYSSVIKIGLTAGVLPYWEDTSLTSETLSGDDEEGSLTVPGTVPSPVSLSVLVTSGTLTEFSVTAGSHTISLDGLSLAEDASMVFERDSLDSLMIRSGTVSLLSKRTAESADDLFTAPGPADLSFTADAECEVVFTARGRWA